MTNPHLVIAAALLCSQAVVAAPQGAAPGLRLYSPHNTNESYLVDTNNNVVQTWQGAANPGNGAYLDGDGHLVRTHQVPGAPPIGGRGGGLERIAIDGTVLWDFELANVTTWAHHDIALLPNGNVLMIAWDLLTAQDAIAAGRDPATLTSTSWLPDAIVEVRQTGLTTGSVVWEWHIMDHVIQDFDPMQANFGVVADHPELLDINYPGDVLNNGEWNHCNGIDYDPVRDIIVLNSPYQDEFWLIDHSTTTAEAAGHTGGNFGKGGDFIYRWGNPAAYDRGTVMDQTLWFQHGSSFIPQGRPGAGNILAYNNRAGTPMGQDFSTVVEIQLPATFALAPGAAYGPAGFVWQYAAPTPTDMYSRGLSNAERLPNGNTMICSGRQGWMFEVTSAGQKVWEYFPTLPAPGLVFQAHYIERTLWEDQDTISVNAGGTVDFDLIAGSSRAGDTYLLLGSASGTAPGFVVNGVTIPLNRDSYFLSTLSSPGVMPFVNTVGTLDPDGRATAAFTLPGGLLPPAAVGLHLDHAFVLLSGGMSPVVWASNPVPLDWAR